MNQLTLEEFGSKVGVSEIDLSLLESGVNSAPSKHLLDRIRSVFTISPEWILQGGQHPFDSARVIRSSVSSGSSPNLRTWANFCEPLGALSGDGINALYQVRELYERLRSGNFENGINAMNGLYELLRYNPQFRLEAEAVRNIWEGASVLAALGHRINHAVDGPPKKAGAAQAPTSTREVKPAQGGELAA